MNDTGSTSSNDRIAVRKTHKLFIGGAFPRSESGRTYEVSASDGRFIANVAKGSRKDARDAVVAARAAQPGWSQTTAYNRGQVLYRVAEMMEGRRAQFVEEIMHGEGLANEAADHLVDVSIDRWLWYAGWCDKLAQVLGNGNSVAGPYFNFSLPEPTGVVATVAPEESSFLGLISVLAPTLVPGNTCVLVTSATRPIPAVTLAEVLATSDVPAGVVNIITGDPSEIMPWLASHADVNTLDLTGLADTSLARDLEASAATTIKRVMRPEPTLDWKDAPGLGALRAVVETKTVWHTQGT